MATPQLKARPAAVIVNTQGKARGLMQWTDVFSEVSRRKVGNCKTLPADEITWQGVFQGQPVCVVSTVRLVMGNLAHFSVNSGARIGARPWKLPGGYCIDLAVESRDELTEKLPLEFSAGTGLRHQTAQSPGSAHPVGKRSRRLCGFDRDAFCFRVVLELPHGFYLVIFPIADIVPFRFERLPHPETLEGGKLCVGQHV